MGPIWAPNHCAVTPSYCIFPLPDPLPPGPVLHQLPRSLPAGSLHAELTRSNKWLWQLSYYLHQLRFFSCSTCCVFYTAACHWLLITHVFKRIEVALKITSKKKIIFRRKFKMLGKLTNTSDVTIASEDETSKALLTSLTRVFFVSLAKLVTQWSLIPFATIIDARNICATLGPQGLADISYKTDTAKMASFVITATKQVISLLELKRLIQK